MSNSYGVEIHGKKVKLNGEEIPNVVSVHYSDSKEHGSRTVVEVDGDFDFEGLSGVEFVFHPTSVREAVEALRFYLQMDNGFGDKFTESVRKVLREYRRTSMSDETLAGLVANRLLEDLL